MRLKILLAFGLAPLFMGTSLAVSAENFFNSMLGDLGAVQIKTCHHPIFTRSSFKGSVLSCALTDESFLAFKRSWDAYSSLSSLSGDYKVIDLTPWRQKGEDDEYQRVYEVDGYRLIISYLPYGGNAEITMLLNPEGGGTGKDGFVDTYYQAKSDPSDFDAIVKKGISEFGTKNKLTLIKCPKNIPDNGGTGYEACFSSQNTLEQTKKIWLSLPKTSLSKAGEINLGAEWSFVEWKKSYLNLSFVGDHHALEGSYFPKLAGQTKPFLRISITKFN